MTACFLYSTHRQTTFCKLLVVRVFSLKAGRVWTETNLRSRRRKEEEVKDAELAGAEKVAEAILKKE